MIKSEYVSAQARLEGVLAELAFSSEEATEQAAIAKVSSLSPRSLLALSASLRHSVRQISCGSVGFRLCVSACLFKCHSVSVSPVSEFQSALGFVCVLIQASESSCTPPCYPRHASLSFLWLSVPLALTETTRALAQEALDEVAEERRRHQPAHPPADSQGNVGL
eukprot:389577-Rhodomonas_salina.4